MAADCAYNYTEVDGIVVCLPSAVMLGNLLEALCANYVRLYSPNALIINVFCNYITIMD